MKKDTDTEILEIVNFIKDRMAMKEDTATKDDIAGIMTELADIKQRLKGVESAVENHAGHSKEIDHAFERIAAIERHLGIKVK